MSMPYLAPSQDQINKVLTSIAGSDPFFAQGNPAMAYDAAQSADPSATAATLAHADATTNAQDAVNNQSDNGGVLGWVSDHLGHGPIGTVLGWLNKPLDEISKDYKFIHAVWTMNGPGAGVLATLGVAGGAAAGLVVGEPLLGAAAALEGERQILGRTLWQSAYKLSENPDYQISMGRDLANLVTGGHAGDSGAGHVLSGISDAAFDFAMDPLAIVGRAAGGLKAGKTLATDEAGNVVSTVPLVRSFPGASNFFAARSLHVFGPDQLHAVYFGNPVLNNATRTYHRALDDLAGMDARTVVRDYPALSPAAKRIGEATDRDSVHQVMADIFGLADTINIVNGAAVLPSRSLLGAAVTGMRDTVANWGDAPRAQQANWFLPKRVIKADEVKAPDGKTVMKVGAADQTKWVLPVAAGNLRGLPSAASKTVRTWTGRASFSITKGGEFVDRRRIDLSNDAALPAVLDQMRMGMSENMAGEYLNMYVNAVHPNGLPDLALRRSLLNSAQLETLKAMGLPDDPRLLEDVRSAFSSATNGWNDGSPSRAYGYGHTLDDKVSRVDAGSGEFPAALHPWQDEKHMTLLDFYAARRAVQDLHKVSGAMGGLDEMYRRKFIEAIFKPTALLTAGFAQRVSASELLQTMMRYGTYNTVKAMIAGTAANMGKRLLTKADDGVDETEQIAAAATHAMAGAGTAAGLPEPTPAQIRAVIDHESTPPEPRAVGDTTPQPSQVAADEYGQTVMAKIGKPGFALANKVDPDLADLATKLIMRNGGHIPRGAVRTGNHGTAWTDVDNKSITDEIVWMNGNRAARAKGQAYHEGQLAWRPGPNHTVWEPESAQFNMHWHEAVNHAVNDLQSRNIVSDVLDHLEQGMSHDEAWRLAVDKDAAKIAGYHYDPDTPMGFGAPLGTAEDPYAAWRNDMARRAAQTPQAHAYAVADDLRNTLTGKDGTFHEALARTIVKGRKVDLRTIDRIDPLRRPKGIIGPEWEPYTYGNVYRRFVQKGFTYLDGIINGLSRSPLYLVATQRELKKLEWATKSGVIDEERALTIAEHRATHAILPQIHNTANRSQAALTATNLFPFWFAQEQAYRRTLRLQADNPAALRYYQIIENGLVNGGFTTKDSNGNSYLSFPFAGAAGQAAVNALSFLGIPLVSGLPMSVDGSLTSLRSVLPETNLPGVSPLVAVAANALSSFDPVLSRYMGAVVGEQNVHASYIDQLIPNSPARSFLKGVLAPEGDRAYQSAVLNALASAYYHGQMPGPDASVAEQQAFADRIKNNARSSFMLKAVLGVVSPLAPQVQIGDPGFRDEFNKLVDKYGDYGVAIDHFLSEHGDKAISYTIGQSQASDARVPFTAQAITYIEQHPDLVRDYPVAAAMLVPQEGKTGDVQAINDELLKMHLRSVRTPEQFMQAIYVAAGNNLMSPAITTHQQNLAAAKGNSQATAAENTAWSTFVQTQRMGNPYWYNNYTSDSRRTTALQGLSELMAVYKNHPEQAQTPHGSAVYTLVRSFMNHLGAQQVLHAGSATGGITAERTNWTQYLDTLAGYTDVNGVNHPGTNPALATVIRTVFLPLAAQNVDINLLQQAA